MLKKILVRIKSKLVGNDYSLKSYSQSGEDLIMEFALGFLNVKNPTYIDIGANHPMKFNNTYFFYKTGGSGVLIEPDPAIFSRLKNKRPNDVCLNVGIGLDENTKADFYIMSWPEFNTLSKERALEVEAHYKGRNKVEKVIEIPLLDINTVIKKYFDGDSPQIISIDVEGLDIQILKTLNFDQYRPLVICVENALDERSGKGILNDFMIKNGYFQYANTHLNSIFVEKNLFEQATSGR